MKRRTKILLWISGLIISIGFFISVNGLRIPFTTGKIKYVIIKSALFNRSDILKQNAALLITDKNEIANNERLFLDNSTYGHACGYHYAIDFWENSENCLKSIPFNQECEEFMRSNLRIQSKMKGYIKKLETNPTHYIYNIQIPVAIEPNEVLESFENSEFDIFFMTGASNRYSSLTFTYKQTSQIKEKTDRNKWQDEQNENAKKTSQKINSIIDSIKTISEVIEQSKISFPMQSFGGGTIDHKGQVTLKFINGTDLTTVKEIIKQNLGEIEKENNPLNYYIQILVTSDNIDDVKEKINKYEFVTGLYEYPKTK